MSKVDKLISAYVKEAKEDRGAGMQLPFSFEPGVTYLINLPPTLLNHIVKDTERFSYINISEKDLQAVKVRFIQFGKNLILAELVFPTRKYSWSTSTTVASSFISRNEHPSIFKEAQSFVESKE